MEIITVKIIISTDRKKAPYPEWARCLMNALEYRNGYTIPILY
ncbi:hypothetical protein [Ornithinibacillus scapharcae]|nr:hypothetical protein [Ornithinibacillus scapharcae]